MTGQQSCLQRQLDADHALGATSQFACTAPATLSLSGTGQVEALESIKREVDMLHTMVSHNYNCCCMRGKHSHKLGHSPHHDHHTCTHCHSTTTGEPEKPAGDAVASANTADASAATATATAMRRQQSAPALPNTPPPPFVSMSRTSDTHSLPLKMQTMLHMLRQHATTTEIGGRRPASTKKKQRSASDTEADFGGRPSLPRKSGTPQARRKHQRHSTDVPGEYEFSDADIARVLDSLEEEYHALGESLQANRRDGVSTGAEVHARYEYVYNLITLLVRYWALRQRCYAPDGSFVAATQ
eukprot:TRINITY_DN135_c0_g2_i6.p2 TRINITY_DN135_c0_g2~~TRINITY_DN135_c0_g2_i6.p2  ORF type:complete len:299 (-),score=76.65 TRINITY_DN135_c0_g2_i6:107-1003(-)